MKKKKPLTLKQKVRKMGAQIKEFEPSCKDCGAINETLYLIQYTQVDTVLCVSCIDDQYEDFIRCLNGCEADGRAKFSGFCSQRCKGDI